MVISVADCGAESPLAAQVGCGVMESGGKRGGRLALAANAMMG